MSTNSPAPKDDLDIHFSENENGSWSAIYVGLEGWTTVIGGETQDEARKNLIEFLKISDATVSVVLGESEDPLDANTDEPSLFLPAITMVVPQIRIIPATEPFGVTMHPSLELTDVDGEYALREGAAIDNNLTSQLPLKIVATEAGGGFVVGAPELGLNDVGQGESLGDALDALFNKISFAYSALVEQMPGAEGYTELRNNLVKWFRKGEPEAEVEEKKAE